MGTVCRKETQGLSAAGIKVQVGGPEAQLGAHPRMVEGPGKQPPWTELHQEGPH